MSRCELTQVCGKYGAPMGRRDFSTSFVALHCPEPVKLRLQRVVLDVGGYDQGGAYWGIGKPLWRAWFVNENGEDCDCYFRAWTRGEAKALFPGKRFYK